MLLLKFLGIFIHWTGLLDLDYWTGHTVLEIIFVCFLVFCSQILTKKYFVTGFAKRCFLTQNLINFLNFEAP